MNFPESLKYVKSHEWVKVDAETMTIGITDFAQSELGDVVFVDITAAPGDNLSAGDVFGTIEAVKTVSDLYMPLSGTISEINEGLGDAPESINNDPYGDGWLIKITGASLDEGEMMEASAYQEMIGG